MGAFWTKLYGKKEQRILMLGLDAAGKTTILYQMKLGEVVTTIPTIGMFLEEVKFKNVTLTTWDLGGRCSARPLWRHYYQNSSAVIYVVDSNDKERMEENADLLHSVLQEDELRETVVLILANKQDLSGALGINTVAEQLKLDKVRQTCYIIGTCATKGEGLNDAFEWLANTVKERDRNTNGYQPKIANSATPRTKSANSYGFSLLGDWFKSILKQT